MFISFILWNFDYFLVARAVSGTKSLQTDENLQKLSQNACQKLISHHIPKIVKEADQEKIPCGKIFKVLINFNPSFMKELFESKNCNIN